MDVESKARQYLYKDGKVMDMDCRSQHMTSWTTVYDILRNNFKGEYISGIRVEDFKVADDKITIYTARKTYESDILVCADGASSFCRSHYEPDVKRVYAGYIAFRGIVPEKSLSEMTSKTLVGNFTFFHAKGTQMLAYLIPGPKGTLEEGKRCMNWVWYNNYPADSDEYKEVMTDKDGFQHPYSVGYGKIAPAILEKDWKEGKSNPTAAILPNCTKKQSSHFSKSSPMYDLIPPSMRMAKLSWWEIASVDLVHIQRLARIRLHYMLYCLIRYWAAN